MWRTAWTTSPVPASPLVRIMAAPSAMRRRASPRLRAPQTNGTVKACLSTWWASSAGVSTSDSSMKSTPSSWSIWASAKWPMRHLAMTGISTAPMISRITLGEAMRAAPAPARAAMSACLAVVTSMMTPPLSISARPVFRRRLVVLCPLFCDIGQLFSGSGGRCGEPEFRPERVFYIAGWVSAAGVRLPLLLLCSLLSELCEHALDINRYKQSLAARQHFPFFIQDLGHVDMLAALHFDLARFHAQRLLQRHRL